MMNRRDMLAAAFLTIVAVFLVFSMLFMHPFGSPTRSAMDQYIIDNTVEETGGNNGVTSVVFDYRGFDTLGEATVLFTAVASVVMLFRRLKK
jgi:multisubunit Na+/H+ antiporter MnhB subunit